MRRSFKCFQKHWVFIRHGIFHCCDFIFCALIAQNMFFQETFIKYCTIASAHNVREITNKASAHAQQRRHEINSEEKWNKKIGEKDLAVATEVQRKPRMSPFFSWKCLKWCNILSLHSFSIDSSHGGYKSKWILYHNFSTIMKLV